MASRKQSIHMDGAPTFTGPFNQAIRMGNLGVTSGQAGRNRETSKRDGIRDQARRCIGNFSNILEASGRRWMTWLRSPCFCAMSKLPMSSTMNIKSDARALAGAVVRNRRAQEPRHTGGNGSHSGHSGLS